MGLWLQSSSPMETQVSNFLRQKDVLLLFDSFEALPAGVTLILDLLQELPRLKILATSRSRLNTGDEELFLLKGLDYPAGESMKPQPARAPFACL